MKYNVLRYFTDLQDDGYPYSVGDTYPREGLTVTPERIEELKSGKNKRGIPVIEEIIEKLPFTEEEPKEKPEEKPKPRRGKKKG